MEALAFGLIALLLTLGGLSYLAGDNPIYRLTTHVFIGVSAGYVAVLALYTVLWPLMVEPLWQVALQPTLATTAIVPGLALLGGIFLLLKAYRIFGQGGTLVAAYLAGVGAAVAVAGAVLGTLIPQALVPWVPPATAQAHMVEKLIEGLFVLVGTLASLGFFHYGGRPGRALGERPVVGQLVARVGEVFIGIAFGVLFAGAIAASLAALAERFGSIGAFFGLFLTR